MDSWMKQIEHVFQHQHQVYASSSSYSSKKWRHKLLIKKRLVAMKMNECLELSSSERSEKSNSAICINIYQYVTITVMAVA